ncbi:hypothetical protein [Actinoplanes sp. ATCC 53533]|uniref:hypothetical protein n=1 Tax=Actinoplanes sp. ATCC 53533 TaxID=1288362 RepID=UPI000F7A7543|nr:hypothetical protein [Actinoplanes sp. ATCC 53533]
MLRRRGSHELLLQPVPYQFAVPGHPWVLTQNRHYLPAPHPSCMRCEDGEQLRLNSVLCTAGTPPPAEATKATGGAEARAATTSLATTRRSNSTGGPRAEP